jgi:hypothetical protein
METVNVAIPAELYVTLYQEHQENTSVFIEMLLRDSCSADMTPTVAKRSFRPGNGTITGRVWEIADEINAKKGSASRDEVVKACISDGLNMNTASTQYSAWKKEND